ncbi:LamG domain-containing protein [Candidatus Nanohalobium constans]|uniref:Concanavalin A-like lectin/glucanases superfamily n=1 Tax=Candidatus Nanohalobium constans TaxID=2565781 RepID=A0A5Q0UGG2_9ARCH|nr:LamG domain-containing protein [Candidatus Nanohalobium constans]QGA80300.1 concanavalin A-like lectin/glucanases superfamily [Candidatus Nanohalobium constans]
MVLIGYWPLNEESGSTAYDHSGNEKHGSVNNGGDSTVVGATIGPTGQNAYSFDGSNDYVSTGFNQDNSSFTVSFWARPGSDITDFSNVIGQGDDSKTSNNSFTYTIRWAGGDLDFYTSDGSSNAAVAISAPKSTWNHYTLSWTGSEMRVFKNGKLEGTDNSISKLYSSTNNTELGGLNSSDLFKGSVSEVRIYNHVLTPQEIQYLYTVSQRGRHVSSKKKS